MPKDPTPISLSEFIYQVKKDLLDKQFGKDDPVPLFAIEEIEIEVGVTATREVQGGVKAGLNLSIIGLGGLEADTGGKVGKENAQTVRVKLTPLLSKEELLETLTPEQRQRIRVTSGNVLTRGEEASSPDSA